MGVNSLVFLALALLFSLNSEAYHCSTQGVPLVRNIGELPQDNFGRPGLSHITVAGSLLHGMKEPAIKAVLLKAPSNLLSIEDFSSFYRTFDLQQSCRGSWFIYNDWFMPHTAAKLKFPYYWDEQCFETPQKDEL
ncbi:hypothetical protein CsSME_00041958 [Camellia sinensis var. sinensis]